MTREWLKLAPLVLTCALHSSRALAQETTPVSEPADAPPSADATASEPAASEPEAVAPKAEGKDVVRLKNGGLVRGTIVELLPGESVTITTALGKTREFAMSEVSYAGPAANESEPAAKPKAKGRVFASRSREENSEEAPRPYVTVHAEEARLALEGEPTNVIFYRQGASAVAGGVTAQGYERLCAAPCEISMPAGVESLALGVEKSKPVEADPIDIPAGNHRIVGRYSDRTPVRVIGWVSLVAAPLVGGLIMMQTRERENCTESSFSGEPICVTEVEFPYMMTGLAVAGIGLLGGLLIFVPDSAQVELSSSGSRRLALRPPSVRYATTF
jgi:hypothetical protein